MPPSIIAVVNQSSKVTDQDVATMTRACAAQIRHDVAPAWSFIPAAVVHYASVDHVPPGAHTITVVDTDPSGEAGTLGWHTEDASGIHGIVAVDPVLSAGGHPLSGDWSVASVLSHEIAEMFVDQSCRGWAASDDGYDYALEVGDPVEGPTYATNGHKTTALANFALPAWFDNGSTGPYDHLGLASRPFAWLHTGYVVRKKSGREEQKFGDEFPAWRRAMKVNNPFSRTNIRISGR